MQLFRLHADPKIAVRSYPDKYTYNQIRECGQICSTALYLNGAETTSTHEHHPIIQWASESLGNYRIVVDYAEVCNSEWVDRYNHPNDRIHGSLENIYDLPDPSDYFDQIDPTLQPCAFPDKYKIHTPATTIDEVVENYRNYIIKCKSKKEWFKYERADPPEWLAQNIA